MQMQKKKCEKSADAVEKQKKNYKHGQKRRGDKARRKAEIKSYKNGPFKWVEKFLRRLRQWFKAFFKRSIVGGLYMPYRSNRRICICHARPFLGLAVPCRTIVRVYLCPTGHFLGSWSRCSRLLYVFAVSRVFSSG